MGGSRGIGAGVFRPLTVEEMTLFLFTGPRYPGESIYDNAPLEELGGSQGKDGKDGGCRIAARIGNYIGILYFLTKIITYFNDRRYPHRGIMSHREKRHFIGTVISREINLI